MISTSFRLYINGINSDISNLYPKVEFPVSRGTRGISSSIKWNHSENWFVPDYTITSSCSGGNNIKISLKDSKFEFLKNYILNGRIMIPAAAYIKVVWDLFNGQLDGVEFSDLSFHKEMYLSVDEDADLEVNIQRGSGNFEVSLKFSTKVLKVLDVIFFFQITFGSEIVCSGNVKHSAKQIEFVKVPSTGGPELSSDDFYTELNLRGYEYLDSFKTVSSSCFQGLHGSVKWNKNWITFIDSLMQVFLVGFDTRSLLLPNSITRVIIHPTNIGSQTVNIRCCVTKKSITSPFVKIHGIKFAELKRQAFNNSIVQAQMFVPLSFSQMTTLNAASVVIQLYLENNKKPTIRVLEDGLGESCVNIETFRKVVADTPLLKASLHLRTNGKSPHPDIEIVDNMINDCDIIISSKFKNDHLKFLSESGYLVLKTFHNKCNIPELRQISTIYLHDENSYFLIFKQQSTNLETDRNIIDVSSIGKDDWLETVKSSTNEIVLLQSFDRFQKIRNSCEDNIIFASNENIPQNSMKMQLELGLSVNIFEKVSIIPCFA